MNVELIAALALSAIPAYIGVKYAGRFGPSIAAGMLLFFFIDFMEAALQLGLESGNPALQLGLLASFSFGLLLPSLTDKGKAYHWPIALGAHSIAEGMIIGLAPLPLSSIPFQAASFSLHKAFEGATIAKGRAVIMAAFISLPALAGFFAPVALAIPYFFAFTAGASLATLSKIGKWDIKKVLLGFLLVYAAGLLHQVG